jgi:hypothetical protein
MSVLRCRKGTLPKERAVTVPQLASHQPDFRLHVKHIAVDEFIKLTAVRKKIRGSVFFLTVPLNSYFFWRFLLLSIENACAVLHSVRLSMNFLFNPFILYQSFLIAWCRNPAFLWYCVHARSGPCSETVQLKGRSPWPQKILTYVTMENTMSSIVVSTSILKKNGTYYENIQLPVVIRVGWCFGSGRESLHIVNV